MAFEKNIAPAVLPTSKPAYNHLPANIKPSALSIDITNSCNLRCKHCFWEEYSHDHRDNLTLINDAKNICTQYSSITNITWYGGEPLLNTRIKALLYHGINTLNKKNNLIVTNGTHEIPDWKNNVHFAVSLDGDKTMHDYLRGEGVYALAKKSIKSALDREVPVGLIYCINKLNMFRIKHFLEEWSNYNLEGIVLTFYVPLRNKSAELILTDEDQDQLSDMLIKLKNEYGKIIYNSDRMLELIKSKYNDHFDKQCPMNAKDNNVTSLHMCNDGTIRIPCALGPEADCKKCRSVTATALYAGLIDNDRSSKLALYRMYHSKSHAKQL